MRVLVLSPHRDDAAFSCGLLMRRLLEKGVSLCVVNVCTVSDYAPYLAPDTRDRTLQVTAVRREEDELFLKMLCGDHFNLPFSLDLGWQDLPLRWQAEERAAAKLFWRQYDEMESALFQC